MANPPHPHSRVDSNGSVWQQKGKTRYEYHSTQLSTNLQLRFKMVWTPKIYY